MLHPLARVAALALIAVPAHVAAQELKGPPAEVRPGPQLNPPVVPGFELPPEEPGYRNVRELRVRGQHDWLGTEITVKGYITWIYDCVTHHSKPGEKPAQVQKRIDDDPTICERPKFYLGDAKDTPPERSIWVVSVPRPPNKMERKRLPKDELARWPAVPKLALGDHVAVTGTWELQSAHGDRNSDGLLVFKALKPAPSASAAAPVARPTPPRPAAPTPKVPPAPPAAPIDPAKRQKSIRQMNEGAKAFGQNQLETAIERYGASVATWPENHVSWFYLAYAYSKKRDWAQAQTVVANSTRLAPDVAMYRMLHGICLYEAAFHRAREAQAAAQARKPEEIVPDMRAVNQDAALAQLALALHLNKDLWRAHYYLGRIHRDRGDAAVAAESFTRAVQYGPPEAAPYVALAELYRRWNYVDHAVMITRLGVNQVVDSNQQADVLYVLGLALDDKQSYDAAIDAYTKAMEARRDLSLALFQRGQDLFRVGKLAAAKADLETFLTRPDTGGMAFARAVASKLLMEIAAKKP